MFKVSWVGNTWLSDSSWVEISVHVNWFTIINNNQYWSMTTKLVESLHHICTRYWVSCDADPIFIQSIVIINAKWGLLRKILYWVAGVHMNTTTMSEIALEMWCKCVSQLYICSQPLRLNLGENIAATPASVSPDIVGVRRQRLIPWRIRRASETSYGSGDVDGGVNSFF